ncbi:MAG: hypothetical protein R8K22_01725 [Mariprofundaceae bacterium]
MNLKSIMFKVLGALAALPLFSSAAFAFTANPAHRDSYNGMTPHAHYDELWHETMLDITVIGVLFALLSLWLLLGFMRKPGQENGESPQNDLQPSHRIGWAVIPMVLFLVDDLFLFVQGFDLHNHYREVPAEAAEVKLTGAMWSWTYEYENGVETYDELVVPVGKPVVMRMTSDDVLHSHYMNQFRVTEDLMPGRITWQWFMPDVIGESVITCREYCGENHSRMHGKVKVLSQGDYDAFMASELGLNDEVAPAADVVKNTVSANAEAKI